MLQIGALVDKKYKILSEIGHGGMSVVYLAINERANKTWAIKEVRKDGVVNFDAVKQGLVVETNMLKRLNHPHLPSIIDVIDTDDSFLIVMDYIEGNSLQSVLQHSGAQPQEQVVEWGKQLCDVLGYLHSQSPPIIYRDMKPANVMLKPDGNITLIDFGTAREFKNRAMVEDTTCLGTRGYAAPEQFGGYGQTDGRTDIYCLGATLYHLLTGHSPADPGSRRARPTPLPPRTVSPPVDGCPPNRSRPASSDTAASRTPGTHEPHRRSCSAIRSIHARIRDTSTKPCRPSDPSRSPASTTRSSPHPSS